MSLVWKMIYGCLTGAWGGFVAWLLLDRVLNVNSANPLVHMGVNPASNVVSLGQARLNPRSV